MAEISLVTVCPTDDLITRLLARHAADSSIDRYAFEVSGLGRSGAP